MKTKFIACTLLLTSLSMIAACTGNGAPSNRDAETAMEEGVRFLLRREYRTGKADVDFKGVSVKDCISQDARWICHAEGEMELKLPRNGETETRTKKFSGDLKLSKTENGWTVDDFPMSFTY